MHKKNIHQTFIISHDILASIFSNINGPTSTGTSTTIFLIVASFFTNISTKMFGKICKTLVLEGKKNQESLFKTFSKVLLHRKPPSSLQKYIQQLSSIFLRYQTNFPSRSFSYSSRFSSFSFRFYEGRDGCANIYDRYIEVKDRTWSKISHASLVDDSK